ncbi:ankyrin repeat domain-containing protein [Terriglobus sp. 2YAB30_2]|uniref:ankyrin repeat domain-containing protein n=2 Tax=unclassified Terriglobus TaxID=2628988 RepID=UPI003F9DA638
MFPNPQEALPQPARLSLEQYRKLAKDLVKVCKTADPEAIRNRITLWIRELARHSDLNLTPTLPVAVEGWIDQVTTFTIQTLLQGKRTCALTDAQFVIARCHGFASWPRFVQHIEQASIVTSTIAEFEAAADAIIFGDQATLKRLIEKNPGLARQRSTREHHATLLHYTSANGVEGYRQRTPANIVAIAEFLLEAGAQIDAEADVYGGGCTTLGLAATSVHPETAGVQEALLQLLLDHGAQIEKPNLAGNGTGAVVSCLANGRLQAAVFLASRGAHLDLDGAAGIGRLDTVKTFFDISGRLLPSATQRQLQKGFLWACMYGWEEVVVFLLEHGADVRDPAETGATGLHWAAGGAHLGIVKHLLLAGSSLEEFNRWGGTVLEHAGYGLEHNTANADFAATFEALLAAGAAIRGPEVPGSWLRWIDRLKDIPAAQKDRIAEIFRRHASIR